MTFQTVCQHMFCVHTYTASMSFKPKALCHSGHSIQYVSDRFANILVQMTRPELSQMEVHAISTCVISVKSVLRPWKPWPFGHSSRRPCALLLFAWSPLFISLVYNVTHFICSKEPVTALFLCI